MVELDIGWSCCELLIELTDTLNRIKKYTAQEELLEYGQEIICHSW